MPNARTAARHVPPANNRFIVASFILSNKAAGGGCAIIGPSSMLMIAAEPSKRRAAVEESRTGRNRNRDDAPSKRRPHAPMSGRRRRPKQPDQYDVVGASFARIFDSTRKIGR